MERSFGFGDQIQSYLWEMLANISTSAETRTASFSQSKILNLVNKVSY